MCIVVSEPDLFTYLAQQSLQIHRGEHLALPFWNVDANRNPFFAVKADINLEQFVQLFPVQVWNSCLHLSVASRRKDTLPEQPE